VSRLTESRIQEYWDWIAVVLFLLLTVDMITSVYAAQLYGVQNESNPLMQVILQHSLPYIAMVHIGVLIIAGALFYGCIWFLRENKGTQHATLIAYLFEVWLAGLIVLGLAIFTNNLLMIFFNETLFSLHTV